MPHGKKPQDGFSGGIRNGYGMTYVQDLLRKPEAESRK
jgi:hypothetical protein